MSITQGFIQQPSPPPPPPTRLPPLPLSFHRAGSLMYLIVRVKNVNCISLCIIYVVSAEGFFNILLIWMASPGPAADCVGMLRVDLSIKAEVHDRQVVFFFFLPLSPFLNPPQRFMSTHNDGSRKPRVAQFTRCSWLSLLSTAIYCRLTISCWPYTTSMFLDPWVTSLFPQVIRKRKSIQKN